MPGNKKIYTRLTRKQFAAASKRREDLQLVVLPADYVHRGRVESDGRVIRGAFGRGVTEQEVETGVTASATIMPLSLRKT
jgi:hypothetical protein